MLGLLWWTCLVCKTNVATQLPGDVLLQGSAHKAPLIGVIWTKMVPNFWSVNTKRCSVAQAVWETLSPQHQLYCHCVLWCMCVSSLDINVLLRTPTSLHSLCVQQRGFKLCLAEQTTALRQNFPNMPRKNSLRRFSSVCTTVTWVCVAIANVTAGHAHRYVTPSSLCRLQHSVVTVPGDHHVHLSSPEVVAPAVSHFLRTKVLLLPSSAAHKLWRGLQKQPCCRLGLFFGWDSTHKGLSRTSTISMCYLTFQKSCLIQLAGQEMSLTKKCQSSGHPGFIVYL